MAKIMDRIEVFPDLCFPIKRTFFFMMHLVVRPGRKDGRRMEGKERTERKGEKHGRKNRKGIKGRKERRGEGR